MLFKPFTCTQGGADTAVETTIATGLLPGVDLVAWALKGIEFNISPNLLKAWAAADSDFTLQCTKRSLSGSVVRVVTFADQDLIASWSLAHIASGTAANMQLLIATYVMPFSFEQLLYAENLYVQAISTGTGQTNVVWGRLFYETQRLTNAEALALVASRP